MPLNSARICAKQVFRFVGRPRHSKANRGAQGKGNGFERLRVPGLTQFNFLDPASAGVTEAGRQRGSLRSWHREIYREGIFEGLFERKISASFSEGGEIYR
jgi:hypothetical protein